MALDVFRFDIDRDGLHRQFGGGLPKGNIMAITGKYGAGKSAICQRLVYGFLRHGHSVTFISTELTTKGFLDQMGSLDYPIREYLLNKKLLYIPVFPLIGKTLDRTDFHTRLMTSPELYEKDVIVIDSISSLLKTDISPGKALELIAFFKKIVGMNKSIILTLDPTELTDDIIAPFLSVSDVYVDILYEISEGALNHIMVVKRFLHATGRVGTLIGFRIEPGAGFIMDITVVA